MTRNAWWIVGGLALVAAFGFQAHRISELTKEVAAVRAEISAPPAPAEPAFKDGAPALPSISQDPSTGLQARLTYLERNVAELTKASQVLVEQGMVPPSAERLAEMQQRFFDSTASEGDRLKALRLLRRNNQIDDAVVAQALTTLQASTNGNFRREILQHLDGLTNAALKQPLIAMLGSETENGMREQLVNALRRFTGDPEVEAKMWDLALNEPNTRVRDQARESLARGPATPERIDQMRAKATNPEASLDERLISFRALRLAKSHTPEMVSDLAAMAQNSTDPVARAKLFKSFNGLTDQSLLPPLVNALQDSDPVVRQNAADSLSSFSDPRVQEWLNHLIQNDTDPAVKREAHAALEHSQRLSKQTP